MKGKYEYPGGRPIRRGRVVERRIWRVPDEGPVTPRLRTPDRFTSAIGFHVAPVYDDEADE